MKTDGLDTLIKGLTRFAQFLDRQATKNLLEKLGKEGVAYAKSQVLNVDTGTTETSIGYRVDGNRLTIEAGGNAVWLEFGTGVAKNPNAYPVPVEGIVGHGEFGKGNGANPEGWWYHSDTLKETGANEAMGFSPGAFPVKQGGWMVHTFGIEQNMFMWKTADMLEERAAKLGLDVIDYGIRYDY